MICLKTRTFAVSPTTVANKTISQVQLWFAWKLVHLQYRQQQNEFKKTINWSCDLLENSYICSIANNYNEYRCNFLDVVICLKTRTFAVSPTTEDGLTGVYESCDLLENSYICSIANNRRDKADNRAAVVICLKTRTFAVSPTTTSSVNPAWMSLWFAWKLVHLQYRQQPMCLTRYTNYRCDLLENSYICSIANNKKLTTELTMWVVICLKTRTFAVSPTTGSILCGSVTSLWFAWKLVHLQYRQQQGLDVINMASSCDLLENSYICSIANN